MEEDDVTRHVQRVVEAIDNELAQISVNAQDNALPGSRSQRMAELFDNYASTVTPSGLSGRVDLLVNRLGGANVVVLVLLIAYLLDKLVLSRMARLNSQVSSIDTGADLETRVSVPGTDELSNLAGAINGMLGDIQTERGRAENLLLNVLRQPISERLKGGETVIVDSFPLVSVLFSDTVGFTKLSASMSAEELVALLNRTFSAFDALADKHGLEKIKTIGDAYMVVGGVPLSVENNAERIAEMALDMHSEVARLNSENKISIDIRIGIHAGPVVAGVIGVRKFSYDLWGDAVNTAARMESHGLPGLIQMTEDMYNGIASSGKFDIEDRGMIDVKGKGDMHTYILKGREVALASATADD